MALFKKPMLLTNFRLGSSFNTQLNFFFLFQIIQKRTTIFVIKRFQTRKGILNDLRGQKSILSKNASTTELVFFFHTENDGE